MRKWLSLEKIIKNCKIVWESLHKRHPKRVSFMKKKLSKVCMLKEYCEQESFGSENVIECVTCIELMKTITFGNFVVI